MAIINVPSLGESISEAIVSRWLKQPGDRVAVDEPVVELETDKVTVEVPSSAAGVLSKQLVAAGSTVAVGGPLFEISSEGTAAAASTADAQANADAAAQAKAAEPPPQPAPAAAKPAAMPAARAEAARTGVDLD